MTGFLETKTYSTKHPILLRNPELKDTAAVAQIFSNPSNIQFDKSCSPEGVPISECGPMIESMRASAAEAVPTRVNFVIVLLPAIGSKEESEVIGVAGFGGIDEIERDGEKRRFADVGVMLNPEWRGRGFAVECMELSIKFAFEELKTYGVSCQIQEINVPMRTLVERKFGWKGIATEGPWGPELRYEILPEEWAARSGA